MTYQFGAAHHQLLSHDCMIRVIDNARDHAMDGLQVLRQVQAHRELGLEIFD